MKTSGLPVLALAAALAFANGRASASFNDIPVRLAVKVQSGDSHDRICGSATSEHIPQSQFRARSRSN